MISLHLFFHQTQNNEFRAGNYYVKLIISSRLFHFTAKEVLCINHVFTEPCNETWQLDERTYMAHIARVTRLGLGFMKNDSQTRPFKCLSICFNICLYV